MEYQTLCGGSRIPALGLGTWQIGGRTEPDYHEDQKSVESIKAAISLGYTLIDTAESYGGGHTEELVGEAINGVDRERLFLVSKVSKQHLGYDDLVSSAKRSLERLHARYLDLYLIHAPNPAIDIKETMEAMDWLKDSGLIRNIGVSNFSIDELKSAQKAARSRIVANQVQYSLISRNKSTYGDYFNAESEIIPYCQENGIIVMADRPLHKGVLLSANYPLLDRLGRKYSRTVSQIALNWLICKKNLIAIPKSTNAEHLKENLGALGWRLDEDDLKLLDTSQFNEA